jgi:hypothetical protein
MRMAADLRLRQICLVAPTLEPAVGDIAEILGLEVCFRDPAVATYGLENALLPIGASLLEVVAPVRPDTAAGRFLERSGGRGGYMAIFDCADPEVGRRRAEALGIRVAHVIRHESYFGVQLHPRDCRAAMIEFNHTRDGGALDGPYHPAGPHWRSAVRTDQARHLIEVALESPDPAGLAAHWSRILDTPADGGREPRLELSFGAIRFVEAPKGQGECLAGLQIAVVDVDGALATARRRGCPAENGAFRLAGVEFRLERASDI